MAGHTHISLSRKSSIDVALQASNAWKTTSPSSNDKLLFPWDMSLASASRTVPLDDGSSLLADYQEKYSSSLLDFTCPEDKGEFVNGTVNHQ